jgi:hypothetical protein
MGGFMEVQNGLPHPVTCHRCGKPMEFHGQEIVDGKRLAVFRCADCDTLEAAEDGKAA